MQLVCNGNACGHISLVGDCWWRTHGRIVDSSFSKCDTFLTSRNNNKGRLFYRISKPKLVMGWFHYFRKSKTERACENSRICNRTDISCMLGLNRIYNGWILTPDSYIRMSFSFLLQGSDISSLLSLTFTNQQAIQVRTIGIQFPLSSLDTSISIESRG